MKYNAILTFSDGHVVSIQDEYGEAFDTPEEAKEAAENYLNDMITGAEVLNMSNPGDYPMPDDFDADLDIVEISD